MNAPTSAANLAAERVTHDLVQGSPEWDQFRMEHDGASEAAAMLGLSKRVSRTALLRAKATGIGREFSDWVQRNVLDHGHAVEFMSRPHVEALIGSDLYPVTCSYGRLSASCDGLTMDGRIAFEHKQWNEALAAEVRAGRVPDEHMPQCQQIMLVTGAERVIFVVSDGTKANWVHTEVLPDQAWFDRIEAGWQQFHVDRAAYVPEPAAAVVTAAPLEHLPAVSVRLDGALSVVSNLEPFGVALRAFVERIPAQPSTDTEFATVEAACKRLKDVEDALDAAETGALASISDVNAMRTLKATLHALARETRLLGEKVVKTRKEEIRGEIVAGAQAELDKHVAGLNARLGSPWIPRAVGGFGDAIKGKRTVDSLRDACSVALANAKIEASALADRLQVNRQFLAPEGGIDCIFLFADFAAVGAKPVDDFKAIAAQRIAEHEAGVKRRADALAAQQAVQAAAPAQPPPVHVVAPTGPALESPTSSAVDTRSPINCGQIGARLGFTLTVAFIEETLKVPSTSVDPRRKTLLWSEAQWSLLKAALITHIEHLDALCKPATRPLT